MIIYERDDDAPKRGPTHILVDETPGRGTWTCLYAGCWRLRCSDNLRPGGWNSRGYSWLPQRYSVYSTYEALLVEEPHINRAYLAEHYTQAQDLTDYSASARRCATTPST